MKRFSLMAKLLLVFLIAGTFMFVLLNTLGVHLMKEQMLEKKKEDLYGTATEYVSDYLMGYYSKRDTTYGDLIYQFGLLEDLSGNRAWLVNNNGTIVMDSGTVGVRLACRAGRVCAGCFASSPLTLRRIVHFHKKAFP